PRDHGLHSPAAGRPQSRPPPTRGSATRQPLLPAADDLRPRRLRLTGLIHRIPGTHRDTATTYGLNVAFFYSKLYLRILLPHGNALLPESDQLPRSLRTALEHLDAEIDTLHQEATLAA